MLMARQSRKGDKAIKPAPLFCEKHPRLCRHLKRGFGVKLAAVKAIMGKKQVRVRTILMQERGFHMPPLPTYNSFIWGQTTR